MPFGLLDPTSVAQFVVHSLAVMGGFGVGFFLTKLLATFLDNRMTGGRSPFFLHRFARYGGGGAVALFTALVVFGTGGPGVGIGGGGGDRPGEGTGSTEKNQTTSPVEVPPVESRVTIKIVLLGGPDVTEERFYKINEETTVRNFSELKVRLLELRGTERPSLELHFPRDLSKALPVTHPAVVRLTTWARENGWRLAFAALEGTP